MSLSKRWILWIVLLAAAVGLVAFDQQQVQVGSIVEAITERAASPTSATTSPAARRVPVEAPMILAIRPRTESPQIDNAFPIRDWRPPPPPPVKPGPPPPPSAPPLPFSVLGKAHQDGQWYVFLRRDERILVVKTLDTIDNAYRVDEIRPPVMTLTYLPIQQRQNVPIGGGE